jgi:hypothetical protein
MHCKTSYKGAWSRGKHTKDYVAIFELALVYLSFFLPHWCEIFTSEILDTRFFS